MRIYSKEFSLKYEFLRTLVLLNLKHRITNKIDGILTNPTFCVILSLKHLFCGKQKCFIH